MAYNSLILPSQLAMHQYILGLLTKLACSGLAPRAQSLFDRARVCGKYRWGKKAVLVAGACIAVVLRESRKGVMMSHLAVCILLCNVWYFVA